MRFDVSNKIVYLDLKYKDDDDDFNTNEKRPFLIRKIKKNKAHLISITSQEKKRVGPLQKLISSPEIKTCLTSEEYPYSYANLNRKIIILFEEGTFFRNSDFCSKKCTICLSEIIYKRLDDEYRKFWLNQINLIQKRNESRFSEKNKKAKEIRVNFNTIISKK